MIHRKRNTEPEEFEENLPQDEYPEEDFPEEEFSEEDFDGVFDEGEPPYDEEYDGEYDEQPYDEEAPEEDYIEEEPYEDEAPAAAGRRGKKRKYRKMSLGAKITIVILAFILVVVLAIGIVVNVVLNKINRPDLTDTANYYTEDELAEIDLKEAIANGEVQVDDDGNIISGAIGGDAGVYYPELDPEDIEWTTPSDQIASSETIYNFLLIGQDAREGETRARSDSMILVTVNKTTKTITMTSFLRDLYVQIPGYSDNRINAAYAYGGMELLDETIEQNFGVHIDANLEVRFEAFEKIIDILGGVDVNLTSAEADYMNLSAGMNHLDGEHALVYSRIRYIDNDFYRTGRQRTVMTCIYNNFKDASITQINQLINQILPLLTTDLSNSEIIAYTADLVPMLSGSTLKSQYIPAEGTYTFNTIKSMAVIVADMDANREILKETLE